MRTLVIGTILLLGLNMKSNDSELQTVINDYITWTTTGQFNSNQTLFSKKVSLSYKGEFGDFEVIPFGIYRSKIESAAKSVSRSMAIGRLNMKDGVAEAAITDYLIEDDHSLVHLLTIVEDVGEWKIQTIQIADEDYLKDVKWELLKKDKSIPAQWKVYQREVEGSNFLEFKIVGKVSLTPKEGVEALIDKTVNSHKYLKESQGYMKVLSISDDELLVYSVFNMPFFFKDRAMCERFQISHDSTTGTSKITWTEDWESAPSLDDNVIAMPVARGSWEFVPNGNDGSIATYTVYTEPGGSIPAWMVNATVGKGIVKELKDVEEIGLGLRD